MELQPLEVKEFHGGITDNPIDNSLHKYYMADNFFVTVNRKLYTRPGSDIWDEDNTQIPVGSQRIGSFQVDYANDLLVQSSKKVYYVDVTWQTLQGPTGNDVMTQGDVNSDVCWSRWNNHLYITNSDYALKISIHHHVPVFLCYPESKISETYSYIIK